MSSLICILGREPKLSVAELAAVLGDRADWAQAAVSHEACVVSVTDASDAAALMAQLGGMVKLATAWREFPMFNAQFPTASELAAMMRAHVGAEGKIRFGISVYDLGAGAAKVRTLRKSMEALAHEVKRVLAETTGRSVRWVTSRESRLSSVIVAKEGLLPKDGGTEVLVLVAPDRIIIGRTVAVQGFEAWGERDFGKPSRSMERGMLPPKLARMMVNVAIANLKSQISNPLVLDPFCGTGTVLMEALASGYRAMGSDSDPKAIEEARTNLTWYIERHPGMVMPALRAIRAEDLARVLAPASVDAIATEPYLGPTRGMTNDAFRMTKIVRELHALYVNAFRAFARIVKSGGRVVFIIPEFQSPQGQHAGRSTERVPQAASPLSASVVRDVAALGFRRVDTVPIPLRAHPIFAGMHELTYARPGQRVGRNIIVFERNATTRNSRP